jgi:hypothetical protein
MTTTLDTEPKSAHDREIHVGDPDAPVPDPDLDEIQLQESAPLQEVYSEEFERYLNRFFKFFPKTPVHVRKKYGGGFVCQKGTRKDGSQFDRPCYPDMIARMLDLRRWQHNHPNAKQPEYFWVAMREPARSSVKAIDLDNKENVLGDYRTRDRNQIVTRPLPILTVEHLQKIKRIYDAFPNHIWCISSATLGLHIWEKLPGPQPLHLIEARTRPILNRIGLAKTEVHPMSGRAFRRPFGQDYFTITDAGTLSDWQEQLVYFEDDGRTPAFNSIFKSLLKVMCQEWDRFLYRREPGAVRLHSTQPQLAQFTKRRNHVSLRDVVVAELNQWADQDFPVTESITLPVEVNPAQSKKPKSPSKERSGFNGKWVQRCREWATSGLIEDDSMFDAIFHLALWFYWIEFWQSHENDRFDKIIDLLTQFCLTKHNGFITRFNLGQKQDVVHQVERAVNWAIETNTPHREKVFAEIRAKRETGSYSTVYFLEPLIGQPSVAPSSIPASSSVTFTECCSVLKEKKISPETWVFQPDDTPLPDALEQAIHNFYRRKELKMNKPTFKKLVRFLNFLRSKGGEGRLSIKALKKMGFSNHPARQHVKHLEEMGLIATQGYCPAAGISKLYRLRPRALDKFPQNAS